MPPDKTSILVVLLAGNVAYWLLVLARAWGSRNHSERLRAKARAANCPAEQVLGSSPRAGRVLSLFVVTNVAYYLVVLAWLIHTPLAGPQLWRPTEATGAAGVVAMFVALGLMGWSFAVFGSWRVRAEITEGHELVTDGPFSRVRHPIYAGIGLFFLASFVLVPQAGFLAVALANTWTLDLRARAEEDALLEAFGSRYRRYMHRTRRLLPGLY